MDALLLLNILQTALLLLIAGGIVHLILRPHRSVTGTRRSLFSRRRDVYQDIVRILTVVGQTGEIRKEDLVDFRSRTQDAALLFDAQVAGYIDEIYTRGVKLMSTGDLLKTMTLPLGDERDRITVEHTKQTIWLADQLAMLGKKFEQYPDVK